MPEFDVVVYQTTCMIKKRVVAADEEVAKRKVLEDVDAASAKWNGTGGKLVAIATDHRRCDTCLFELRKQMSCQIGLRNYCPENNYSYWNAKK